MQYVELEVDHFLKNNIKACRHRIRLRHKSDLIATFVLFQVDFRGHSKIFSRKTLIKYIKILLVSYVNTKNFMFSLERRLLHDT